MSRKKNAPAKNEIVAIEALEIAPDTIAADFVDDLNDFDALLTAAGDQAATLEAEADTIEAEAPAEEQAPAEAVDEDEAEEEEEAVLVAVTTEARRLW